MQDRFRAKTWHFRLQAVTLGLLTLLCLISAISNGTGQIEDEHGRTHPERPPMLIAFVVGLGTLTAVAVFNVVSRRNSGLRCFREGIEVVAVGHPLVVGRLDRNLGIVVIRRHWEAFSLPSRRTFTTETFRVAWDDFHGAGVTGRPMARLLHLVGPLKDVKTSSLVHDPAIADDAFADPIDRVSNELNRWRTDALARAALPSWETSASLSA